MWFKWEFFPCSKRAPRDSKAFFVDRLQLTLFFFLWLGLIVCSSVARGENIFLMLFTGFFIPQLISFYFIGFITLQQHTHPRVAWYSEFDPKLPSFFESQMQSTPHLVFPRVLRILMRNTMEHTAHHLDTALPFYRLSNAQINLEHSFDQSIVRQRWTFLHFVQNTRICKLYDYTMHQWVGYHGEPLAKPIFSSFVAE
jgi:omega-6 fatty acid desaturase (delta-12 desaturase)